MTDFAGTARPAESMVTESTAVEQPKRRRTREADVEGDLAGLTDQLNAVSLAISAAMDNEDGEGDDDAAAQQGDAKGASPSGAASANDAEQLAGTAGDGAVGGMEELRRWYQTEVFAATEPQQQRWEERRWAFLGRLQHVLRKPLTHTVFSYRIQAACDEDDDVAARQAGLADEAADTRDLASVFGGLLFVGRSRYNDVVVADETVSRVHCIIVRSAGKVGVFDGWSSYGTMTLARGDASKKRRDSCHENRRPLLFDQGEPFVLRVGKNATILFPGH